MYIVNTTFSVDHRLHGRWFALVTEHYIPFLKECGAEDVRLLKLLTNENTGSFTYSLQVTVDSVSYFETYKNEYFTEYMKLADPLFGEGVLCFNSVLKIV